MSPDQTCTVCHKPILPSDYIVFVSAKKLLLHLSCHMGKKVTTPADVKESDVSASAA